MNVITIELCAEDRARLDNLRATLDRMIRSATPETATVEHHDDAQPEEPAEVNTVPAEQEAPAEVEPEPEKAPEPQPEPVKVDKSAIQKMVVALSGKGKKEAVRSIVLAYGNTKVSDIPADKLTEVWTKLTKLAEG